MKPGAALADPHPEAHHRVPMSIGQALDGADATALRESGDDRDLFVEGEDVHGARSLKLRNRPVRL